VVLLGDCIPGPPPRVEIEEVYERMRRQLLHWNVSELKKIREDPAPGHALGMNGMLGLFRELQERLGMYTGEKAPDGGIVEEYIRMLYKPEDVNPYRVWRMDRDSAEPTKNMLGALLRKMVEKADQQEAGDAEACLLVMSEGMRKCPDGQAEGLRTAYQMICGLESNGGRLSTL
jgi:hypothetical protein